MNKLEESEIGSRILNICLGHILYMYMGQNQFEIKSTLFLHLYSEVNIISLSR